jgi:DNA-binding NtrC family response regulator
MEKATVLLVFEESQDLQYYGSIVCSLGYSARMCNSMEEGIEAIRAANFSLAIVSQGTPAFEGRKVLEFSLQLRPDLPVLVIARSLNVHCYLEAMDLGASDYLERPEPEDMVWVVNTQIHRAGNVPASSKWGRNENHIQTVRTQPHAA